VLDGGGWLTSHPGQFIPRERDAAGTVQYADGPQGRCGRACKNSSLRFDPGPSATATLSRDRNINENGTSKIGAIHTDHNVILRLVSATIAEEENQYRIFSNLIRTSFCRKKKLVRGSNPHLSFNHPLLAASSEAARWVSAA